jgi:hypothetical protein
MKKTEFEKAPLREKVYRVLQTGKPITARQFLHYHIKLYAFSDFFVELWYVPASNKIDRVEIMSLDELLNLYKNAFDISDLLN